MNRSITITILIFFIFGGFVGFFIHSVIFNNTSNTMRYITGNKNYPFISQRLDSESVDETNQGDVLKMKNQITNYIQDLTLNGQITKVAVYYRDLNNGPWMGINENDEFSPASLLKVPIMMSIYKLADANKKLLSREVINQASSNGMVQDILPTKQITKGEYYTIEELVNRMIIYSDNEAKNILLSQINNNDLDQIYQDFGMAVPGFISLDDFMSVHTYSSFFRVLYNGSYLSRDLSNKALELLSRSDYKDGLIAGVPENIKVSHKFGERGLENGIKQLHDCGIVYDKDSPYILCVMTRGYDWQKQANVIKNISKMVYERIKN